MSTSPYMPFYTSDYVADTPHLTLEQHGAYLLLIIAYWQKGGALPDNDKQLALCVHTSLKKWYSVREEVIKFFIIRDGKLFHERIEEELAVMRSKSDKATRSIRKRWDTNVLRTNYECNTPRPADHAILDSMCVNTPLTPQGEDAGEHIVEPETIVAPIRKSAVPPTIEECVKYFVSVILSNETGREWGERFFWWYDGKGWKLKDDPIVNWKSLAQGWIAEQRKRVVSKPEVTIRGSPKPNRSLAEMGLDVRNELGGF